MRTSRLHVVLGAILIGVGIANAQNSEKPVAREVQLQIQLVNDVKATKAKVGDTVNAISVTPVTLPGGVVVPAASKVLGHVRKVEADLGDAHSSLIGLSFDEIRLKGQTVSLKGFIFAAMMPQLKSNYEQRNNQPGSNMPPIATGSTAGMGARGGAAMPTNGADALGAQTRGDMAAHSTSDSQTTAVHNGQVANMPGVELAINESEHTSTFKSSHKNLELDQGLELMLVVQE